LGHAIERETGYTIRHGEAIAVGMMFAAKLSQIHLDMSQELLQRHKSIFSEVGLPIKSPKTEWAPLLQSMSLDKKARGNTLRFIGLTDVGRCQVISNPSETSLIDAFGSVT
jgi:3-dehydroquinate synthase